MSGRIGSENIFVLPLATNASSNSAPAESMHFAELCFRPLIAPSLAPKTKLSLKISGAVVRRYGETFAARSAKIFLSVLDSGQIRQDIYKNLKP